MKSIVGLTAAAVLLTMMPSLASAQAGDTASGALSVTATVHSSIQLLFNSDGSGVALSSGAGTNAATLNFGTITAYSTLTANVSRSVGTNTFTVSTPVDVLVNKANSTSANYTLKAQLG